EAKGWTRARLAKETIRSESLVAAWEGGRAVPRDEDIKILIRVLPFGPDVMERFLEDLVTGEVSPQWTGKWRKLEKNARELLSVEHSSVPGLLQIEDYAREILEHDHHSPIDVERRLQDRMERQEIFNRDDPPKALFLIAEQALTNLVGTPQIMHD